MTRGLREAVSTRPRLAVVGCLAGLVVISTCLRGVLSGGAVVPWIFVDELIYSELGRSAFDGTAIRGMPVSGYGYVYPYLIAPVYATFENLVDAYTAVKWLNSLVMSLVAIPVYLTAVMLMRRAWALVAAALSVLIPGMAYTSVVMTESAFYPALALSLMLMVRSLVRPGVVGQILVFASIFLCFETRPQGIVLAPAYIVAVAAFLALGAWRDADVPRAAMLLRRLVRFAPTLLVALAGLVVILDFQRFTGRTLGSVLGAYSITVDSGAVYNPRSVAAWAALHLAETALWLGIIPVFALVCMVGFACSRSASDRVRAFVAVAVPVWLLMTLLVAAFVVFSNVGRIEERNLFYVGPVFLIALCWWLSTTTRGAALPNWALVALVFVCGLPLVIPYEQFLNQTAVSDTFGLFLPWAVSLRVLDPTLLMFVMLVACTAAAVVVLGIRPRRPMAVLLIVALFLTISSIAVQRRTDRASSDTQAGSISLQRDWIDAQGLGEGSVAAVYPGGSEPLRLWQAEFFNRAVGPVFTLNAPLPGSLPETVVVLDAEGRVTDRSGAPVTAEYALVDAFNAVAGGVVARDARHRMLVVRREGPMRVPQTLVGVFGDGWSGAYLIYTRYACSGGSVTLQVSSELRLRVGPVPVTPRIGDARLEAVAIPPTGEVTPITVSLTPADGVCQVVFDVPDTVIPQTVTGEADTRPLGVFVHAVEYRAPTP